MKYTSLSYFSQKALIFKWILQCVLINILVCFCQLQLKADSYDAWRGGSANLLQGKALTWICFLSANSSAWTDKEKKEIIAKVEEAHLWLISQAKQVKIPLTFQLSSNELADQSLVEYIHSNQQDQIERTNVLFRIQKKMGFTRKHSLLNWMQDSTTCDHMHCLIFVKGRGNSYSLPYRVGMNKLKYFVEGSILFSQYESGKNLITSSIAHELLHLYGAWDLYKTFAQTADREKKANEKFPHSIMLRTYMSIQENMVDELTAWLIGWNKKEESWYSWFKPNNF